MNNGWIKLYRKITDSPVFDNPKLLKTWVWCLCKAAHSEKDVIVGKQIVHLEAGQFVFGRRSAAEKLKMNERTVYDYMHTLKDLQMIRIHSNNKYSLITIENWGKYQQGIEDYQQQTTQQTTQQSTQQTTQQTTHKQECNKNVKNVKNVKKHIYGEYRNVRLTDDEKNKFICEFGEDEFIYWVKAVDEYKEQTGKKYNSDYMTMRQWRKKREKNNSVLEKDSTNKNYHTDFGLNV